MVDHDEAFAAIKTAESLSTLAEIFETESVHESYFRAKEVWESQMRAIQTRRQEPAGLPGQCVVVDGHEFHVHGVTHAGTDRERSFLRQHVREFLDSATVYCEQGIRSMYFEDLKSVCEMDDYLWAMDQCAKLDCPSHVESPTEISLTGMLDDISTVTDQFRDATFSLIDAGSELYGDRFEQALGDIAAGFLTDHADLAVGKSYEAFRLSQQASREPSRLGDLQRYYERTFLPQPLEREWLRRHDKALEIVSHARNERMADYALYHNNQQAEVHLIVGAAHQPGVCYYLERYSEGRELPTEFVLY